MSLARLNYVEMGPDHATLGQIMFVAPDIDARAFAELVGNFPRAAGRITLYASSEDRALKASRAVRQYPRAGDSGAGIVFAEGVDTIDATTIDTNLMSPSYTGRSELLSDMGSLLQSGLPPERCFGLMSHEKEGRPYYTFKS